MKMAKNIELIDGFYLVIFDYVYGLDTKTPIGVADSKGQLVIPDAGSLDAALTEAKDEILKRRLLKMDKPTLYDYYAQLTQLEKDFDKLIYGQEDGTTTEEEDKAWGWMG